MSITDKKGNVKVWSSAGQCGFRSNRKATTFAAQRICQNVLKKAAKKCGLRIVEINLKGPGYHRKAVIRTVIKSGLLVRSIRELTPVPHNGCRPKKRRKT